MTLADDLIEEEISILEGRVNIDRIPHPERHEFASTQKYLSYLRLVDHIKTVDRRVFNQIRTWD